MDLFPPSAGGGEDVSHGYKGKGLLIHLLVDGNGRPIAVTSTAADENEREEVLRLLDQVPALSKKALSNRVVVLEVDKGYDCAWLRRALLIRGLFPFIPFRKIKGREIPKTEEMMQTFHLEKNRWKVERAFSWVKRKCRRLLIRWERTACAWISFIRFGIVYFWLGILVG